MKRTLAPFIRLIRPHQWLKNVFIFLPLFFSGQSGNLTGWLMSSAAFVSFSLASGSIYCFNDIIDVEEDRLHRLKKKRPIAGGQVTVREGYFLMFLLLALSVGTVILFQRESTVHALSVLAAYWLMNIAYCLKLKQLAIIDVFVIATGFVLRVVIGGVVTGIVLSHWIIIMSFLLSLFLAFAKRRDDVMTYRETGVQPRRHIHRYNADFMNQVLTVTATVTMVGYIMYTVSEEVTTRFGSQYVYLTSLFVLAGIIRYLQLTLVETKSGSPTDILLHDRFIQACVLCWILAFCLIIYA
ncbi:MAG: decaprenyl-phosphate phosphoribosyltransferase [Tannerellaceae bacterium]|jgi:4-hydroxybenzoate polyprenyltransferase|nr:decaprenyl-phosphate phosphoribosyltransferase [Tannerellaceae bacterium]